MNLREWRGRCNDAINPIVVKELRQAVRGRFVVTMLVLSLLSQMIIVIGAMIGQRLESTSLERTAVGSGLFMTIFTVLFFGTIVLVPMYAGFRMMSERSDSNVDLLFITTIRPRNVVAGKILSAAVITALIFSASIPFLVFSYVLRGIDFISITIVTVAGYFFIVSQSMLALFVGALPASRPFKLLLGIAVFVGSISETVFMSAFAAQYIRFGVTASSSHGMTGGLAAVMGLTLILDLLLAVLTIALISPPSANRALPIRLFLSIMWVLLLGLALWVTIDSASVVALLVWAIGELVISSVVLFSAIGEREEWGPRVARTIPLDRLRRAVAFVFFSGGGGTIWAVLMMAITIGTFGSIAYLGGPADAANIPNYLTWLLEGAMCIVGYAGTALLLRRTVLSRRVPVRATWAVVLILFVLLAILPPIAAFALEEDTSAFGIFIRVATITNPFPMTSSQSSPWLPKTIVLCVWAGLAIAVNAGWAGRMFGRFRRPTVRTGQAPPTMEPLGHELSVEG